ncbi:hypothetical protein LTR70_003091 [Exophiala xenobiotica]|uniref:Uncharacterized protein n=1 Tax=Lithohypha guttulata TaxID=1690604 RepID=A0ABR0KH79_9EURO|nr:hypothetical protein LTR24_002676 [Lithohypha guttulata]KAK5323802.1 hypothetical protein LTR70_003091 [Exophiala xenobiotica]
MAQTSQPLGHTPRSRSSIRWFSNSTSRSKTLATFTPTSSSKLDTLFSEWRSKVFLPSILPPHHTKLIYKESKNEILTTPPGVTVTVQTALPPNVKNATEAGEENIKLQPLDMFDRPNVNKSLDQITEALTETSDAATWNNLIPFLEGMQLARQGIGATFLPRLARRANIQGKSRWDTILTAATMAKRTDVRLDLRDLTRELILGAHHRATTAAFANSGPGKTVERIVLMLEADEHCGKHHLEKINNLMKKSLTQREFAMLHAHTDMRRDPFVIAAKLSFASADVLRNSKGKDTDGLVAKTTQQLLTIADSLEGGLIKYIQQHHTKQGLKTVKAENKKTFWRDNQVLEELSVVHCALGLANKVDMQPTLGKEKNVQVHTAIRRLLDAVVSEVALARSSVVKASADEERRCFQMLDAVQDALKKL